ncbi:MAG: SRPBCC family protein [Steroidobacteraceae bacterium]
MTERTRGYAHRVDVAAAARAVWDALTDSHSLNLWCAPGARISARPGGSFRANVDRVTETEALIDIYEPPRRMRLIHLPSPEIASSRAALVDDFMLDEASGGATLRLLGSGFPSEELFDAIYLRRRIGWQRALARLKVLVEGAARG